jgi:hypothetical protein
MWTFGPRSSWTLSTDTEKWAQFGEYVGGIFGILAFISVLITVEIQRRQLDLQRVQVTLDQLMRLSQDFAIQVDEILNRPSEVTSVTQKLSVAAGKRNTVGGVLELVDLELTATTIEAMPPLSQQYEGFRNSIKPNAENVSHALDLLATSLLEFDRRDGSGVIVTLYRDRYGPTVRRLTTLRFPLKTRDWWLERGRHIEPGAESGA